MKVKLWQLYVFPVLLVAFGVYEYIDLTAWENEGGVRYMGRTSRALYKLGGKWGVLSISFGAAALWSLALFTYIRHTRRIRNVLEAADERTARREVDAAESAARAAEPKPIKATGPIKPAATPAIPTLETAPKPEPTAKPNRAATGCEEEPSILK